MVHVALWKGYTCGLVTGLFSSSALRLPFDPCLPHLCQVRTLRPELGWTNVTTC